jgi:hypothetical protein
VVLAFAVDCSTRWLLQQFLVFTVWMPHALAKKSVTTPESISDACMGLTLLRTLAQYRVALPLLRYAERWQEEAGVGSSSGGGGGNRHQQQ